MRVGVLGSRLMGGKLGTIFARAGHEVVFSYARSKEKLKGLARDARGNARAGTPREAAQGSDTLLLAVHWSRIDDVLSQAGDLAGKAMVSCSLPMNEDDSGLVVGYPSSGAERDRAQGPGGPDRWSLLHGAERGALRCIRGALQPNPAEPGLLR